MKALLRTVFLSISGLWLALAAPGAAAQGAGITVSMTVVEFYNVYLDHYFMTLNTDEIADIDAGKAGPGWVRTGYTFAAFPDPPPEIGTCLFGGCFPLAEVSRFYSRLSNSHFFTADAAEAQGLIDNPKSEWKLEAKELTIPVPDASGQCPASLTPVYRFYNGRFQFNDSNHRFVTNAAERQRMRDKGWYDEGVRFCSYGASETPIKAFYISPWLNGPYAIRPSAQCEDESINIGPCIAINNLPTPDKLVHVSPPIAPGADVGLEYLDRTGVFTLYAYVVDPSLPQAASAQDVFVQQADNAIGLHVDTLHRGANSLSSVNPLYQLHNSAGPGLRDDRFFPFGAYESDVELAISFEIQVRRLTLQGSGSAGYGHPTLEFVDTKSGHHVYFTVLTYGTVPSTDYLAIDSGTGKVIVGTAFRPDASYGRSLGDNELPIVAPFDDPDQTPGDHGNFEFRMTRDDFAKVLASARTLDPALSTNAADYLLDNFHFNNEVAGDGEIGLWLTNYTVQLFRR
jgi:hypothetical protein